MTAPSESATGPLLLPLLLLQPAPASVAARATKIAFDMIASLRPYPSGLRRLRRCVKFSQRDLRKFYARTSVTIGRSRARRVLLQLQLQRAAGDPEAASGLGDVLVAVGQDALDVLPLGARQRRRGDGRAGLDRVRGLARQGGDDLIGVDRLAQIVVRSRAQRLDGGGDAAVAGEDDDARRGRELSQRGDQGDSRRPRHPQIDDGELGGRGARRRQGAVVIAGGRHRVAPLAQGAPEPLAKDVVVVDQQDGPGGGHGALPTGSERMAVVPAPGVERIDSSPPSRSTMARARKMPRPIPRPAGLVVKNGSPTRARSSGAMPAPRSAISNTSRPAWSSDATRSVTGAPGGEAWRALSTNPRSACPKACRGRAAVVAAARGSTVTATARSPSSRQSARISCTDTRANRSPAGSPASTRMRARIRPQRSTSARMSRTSSPAAAGAPSATTWRSRSLATTAMVDSGVASSCAAPAASVASEASRSCRAARL